MKTIENRIKAKGGIAHSVRCDMGNLHDLQVLIDETLGKFGAIHGLINNAGVNYVKPFLDTTEADWERVIGVDLKGSFSSHNYVRAK